MILTTAPAYENIKTEVVGSKKNVGLIQLHRPKALNALCKPLFVELGKAVLDFDADDSIAAIIITGLLFYLDLNVVEAKDVSQNRSVWRTPMGRRRGVSLCLLFMRCI